MFEIPWLKYSNKEFRYAHEKYEFRWKLTAQGDRYEIYENGVLKRNALTYWPFMSKAQKIIRGEVLTADIWK